ncbi:MAG TPA: hypothetical protein VGV39_07015 [Mesorhizobium sp.]|jgi:hypothetical protein|uniref:hypothetical protein n=1 Tax=Mesorhizobium sp. TaxID=1871066 RepID=UPI002DDD84B2|nr:hypothetical protein [Mesorhizobium sp.]HEV2502808.1 hypothetical protein [Mesorhizobium sp.]
MLRKIIIASAFAVGLAGSAMAQGIGDPMVNDRVDPNQPAPTTVEPQPVYPDAVDTTTTQSIHDQSGPSQGNSGAGPCAYQPAYDGPQPGNGPIVNDNYCGK